MNRWILCATCVLFLVAQPLSAAVSWETISEGVQIGRIKVLENRAAKSDRTMTLAFARLSTTSTTPRAPIVYLAGGPGQAAIPIARSQESLAQFAALRAISDVILLDQRGIGESQAVRCKAGLPPAPDSFTETGRQRSARFGIECLQELRASGIDIAAYNTNESADDLDDLRRELGVPRLSLLGFSYGTHLGLAAIRRHGAVLERVVLVGTEGPDHTWKLPSAYDTHAAKLTRYVAADPAVGKDVPDFDALLRRVASRLDAEPMTMRIRDLRAKSDTDVTVDGTAFRTILIQDFGDASDLPYFPAMLHQLERGDTSLFRWFVEKRWNGLGGRGAALYFAVDCASGVTPSRRSRIEIEARSAALGNEMNAGYAEVSRTRRTSWSKMPVTSRRCRSRQCSVRSRTSSLERTFVAGLLVRRR